jgi:branched-chain amino acid transport system ATP-binding protein
VDPLLEARAISRSFGGVQALDRIELSVNGGEVLGLIGPNGAGKTTLLNLLTGIYSPSAGRIYFGDRDLTGRAPHEFAARGIARTFQNLQVFFNMSALENVMVGRYRRERCSLGAALLRTAALKRAERACREEAAELMRFVGLSAWLDAGADAMPYGALKRLEIARALATQPRLLLLDEPAAGLNPAETQEIVALIGKLSDRGHTVMLVEHNMRLVMGVSDRVLVLDYGRKLAEGSGDEVRRDARVIEAYLGAADASEPRAALH